MVLRYASTDGRDFGTRHFDKKATSEVKLRVDLTSILNEASAGLRSPTSCACMDNR